MTQAEQFALDALAAPTGIVPGHLLDESGSYRVDRWATWQVRVGPVAGHQATMPAQDRRRGDEPMGLQRPGQESDQGGEYGSVRPVQARLRVLPAQDGVLVAQDENLDVLGCGGPCEQRQPAGDPAEHEVEQA
ncbi:hypothetical protein [Micromonospora sp. NPDC051296]|uniref:hypothetical protein n=1 Tax=Micromonospora sp. NPDC051296 TaxID=3155046 RepID=UPI003434E19A